jgi:hypothetical protein
MIAFYVSSVHGEMTLDPENRGHGLPNNLPTSNLPWFFFFWFGTTPQYPMQYMV